MPYKAEKSFCFTQAILFDLSFLTCLSLSLELFFIVYVKVHPKVLQVPLSSTQNGLRLY